jgi:hypothetical protein
VPFNLSRLHGTGITRTRHLAFVLMSRKNIVYIYHLAGINHGPVMIYGSERLLLVHRPHLHLLTRCTSISSFHPYVFILTIFQHDLAFRPRRVCRVFLVDKYANAHTKTIVYSLLAHRSPPAFKLPVIAGICGVDQTRTGTFTLSSARQETSTVSARISINSSVRIHVFHFRTISLAEK